MVFAAARRRKLPAAETPREAKFNVLFEHTCLVVMTAMVCLAFVIWLVAVSTDYWVIVIAGSKGILLDSASKQLVFLWSYSGLWRRCDIITEALNLTGVDFDIDTQPEKHFKRCHHHTFSPPVAPTAKDSVGGASIDFVQAELTIVVIVLVLMTMAVAFSVYALVHPRYMYKRVAGFLHFITSVTLVVLFGLVRSSEHLAHHQTIHPEVLEHSKHYFGYSLLLGVTVLFIFISAGFAFVCLSKKRRDLLYDSGVNLK